MTPVGIQLGKAGVGPTSGPTWRLSHFVLRADRPLDGPAAVQPRCQLDHVAGAAVEQAAVLVGREPLLVLLTQRPHLGEAGPLSHGVQAGRKALTIRHMNGMEVRKKRPRGSSEPPEPPVSVSPARTCGSSSTVRIASWKDSKARLAPLSPFHTHRMAPPMFCGDWPAVSLFPAA
jgi:hypothetical protein